MNIPWDIRMLAGRDDTLCRDMEAEMSVAGIYRFYLNGFRSMTLGKTLWKIILIKLFVMFAILKLFFFQDYLGTHFTTDEERAAHVLEQITRPAEK